MKDINKAIAYLKKEYDRALVLDGIRNPIAYALYRTWRHFDKL